MPYDEKKLKTDLEGKPIPQAFNADINDFEPVESISRALKQVLYGPNGQPISVVGDKVSVRATELEALMQGFATEGKLEQTRQELISTKNELALVKAELENIKIAMVDGSQKVQSVGTILEHYGPTAEQRPDPSEVPVGSVYMAVNTEEVWQSNGFEWVVLV